MPVTHYLVPAADLASIASAIRSKAGTSSSLSFPTGFISAIRSISGSGSSTDLNSLATYIKTQKHIHPGVLMSSVDDFELAFYLSDMIDSGATTMSSGKVAITYQWKSTPTILSISAKSSITISPYVSNSARLSTLALGAYYVKNAISTYVSECVYLTSSKKLMVTFYNHSTATQTIPAASVSLSRRITDVAYYYLSSVAAYSHFNPVANLTWYRDLNNRSVWLSGSGVVSNFSTSSRSCWRKLNGAVYDVYLSGISTVGSLYFYDFNYLSRIYGTSSVINIGKSAFAYCPYIENVSFPECQSVGYAAFQYCSSMETATFGNCTYISSYAFAYCSNLRSIYLSGSSVPILGFYAFRSTPIADSSYLGVYGSIYVPASLLTDYQVAEEWSEYSGRLVPVYD